MYIIWIIQKVDIQTLEEKADKTGDILIHRIVTGESYTLSSYILGDSNLYYTIYNIKTQQHQFQKVDLVTKRIA